MKRIAFFAAVLVCVAVCVSACGGPRDPDEIIAQLDAKDPRKCQYLALELRAHGEGSIPAWIEVLDTNDNYNIHRLAASELASFGPKAAAAIPVLVRYLRDGFPGMKMGPMNTVEQTLTADAGRQAVRATLYAIGEPAVPAVRAVLAHANPRARQVAALTLGQIGTAAKDAVPELVPELVALLGDKDRAVAAAATWAISEIGSAEAGVIDALRANLGDKEPVVRHSTLRALRGFGTAASDCREDVRKLAGDPDAEVRKLAVEVLRAIAPAVESGKAEFTDKSP